MPNEDSPNSWEFAQYALQRNDEAIRFSETKAAVLLTLIGLFLGLIADKIPSFKTFFSNPNIPIRVLSISSMIFILIGIILVAVASFATIFPRLHVSKEKSYLYFQHLVGLKEQDFTSHLESLDSKVKLNHTISQVHATSIIANRKFGFVRVALFGAMIVILGSLLATITFLFV